MTENGNYLSSTQQEKEIINIAKMDRLESERWLAGGPEFVSGGINISKLPSDRHSLPHPLYPVK